MKAPARLNIFKSKEYLRKYNQEKYKPDRNTNFYLASVTKSIGYYILKKIFNIKSTSLFENFIYIISDIYFGINYSVKIIKRKNFKNSFSKIVLTWGFKKDFDKNGVFYDKYFNTYSSTQKKILWLIVYLDNDLPKKISSNLVVIKAKGYKILNLLSWLKFLFFNTPKIFKSFDFFLVNISSFNFFSKRVIVSLKSILNKKYDEIIIPYEGQPFQNEIIKFLKNKDKNTLVTGYIHSLPVAVPTNFIHKQFSPDRIFLNGKDQIFCFNKILGWPMKKLNYIPSLRFRKSKIIKKKKILIPYLVKRPDRVLSRIEYIHKKISNLNGYTIQSHPAAKNFKSNLRLVSKMQQLIDSDSFLKQSLYDLIFVGHSGGISEFLENGFKILHICEDPEFECFQSEIWKSIKTTKISKNIFSYKLKKKGNLINFGKNNTDLNSILDY